jgi:hypothetical protein
MTKVPRFPGFPLTPSERSKEKAMTPQTGLALKLTNRIARRTERIAKWDKECDEIETSWTGGPDYRRSCGKMAGAARAEKAKLEAELEQLRS